MKIVVFNLGCKVNQYECDIIAEKLAFEGHDVTQELSVADAYVINTCAVTSEAERKSRQAIARCKKLSPEAHVYVLGCASQNNPSNFQKDNVKYILGTNNKLSIVDRISDGSVGSEVGDISLRYEKMDLTRPHRTRAFVKIQDGCDHYCSYCIIPYVRGRSRSREISDVEKEIRLLSTKTKEIVLTGIDVMSFGKDTGTDLIELFKRIKDIDARIRLSSIYAEKISEELLDSLFSLKHFCPHFHLSLQSGDNSVLRSMNRHYTAEEYLSKIELIRKYNENSGITTDVIVGFPTETNEAFANTCSFVRMAGFSDLHIFPYSARCGTVAAKMKPLPPETIKTRKNGLFAIKEELHGKFLGKNVSVPQNVLLEQSEEGYNVGYSENYIKIYTKKKGDVLQIVPKKIFKDGLMEVEE